MSASIEGYFARYGPGYRWIATVTVMMAAITVVLSATIVNVAVPHVMGAFGIGLIEAQWMATAFLASMTVSQLLSAWVLDTLGTRVTYVGMLLLFALGAALAITSPNIEILALGRMLQGIAAGVIQPLSMVILAMVFPPERRGFAMGIYSMGVVLAPAIGPAVGGITIDALSWRWVFLIPLPVCALAILAGLNFLPTRPPGQPRRPFDWTGLALLATSIVCLLTVLAQGQQQGWLSDRILLLTLAGLGAAGAFVVSQLRSPAPLLDFAVLGNRQFASACLIAFVFGSGLFATTYYVPVFVQSVLSFTPTQAGLLLAPAGFLLMVLLPLSGRLSDSVPAHYLIICGLLVLAAGFVLMAGADVNTPYSALVLIILLGRGGMGFIQPPLRTAAVRALAPEQLARGSGTLNFFRQLGGAFGVSLLVVAIEQRSRTHSELLAATQTADNETSRALLGEVTRLLGEAGLPEGIRAAEALRYLGEMVYTQALSLAFQDAAGLIALVFTLTVLPALLLSRGKTTA